MLVAKNNNNTIYKAQQRGEYQTND